MESKPKFNSIQKSNKFCFDLPLDDGEFLQSFRKYPEMVGSKEIKNQNYNSFTHL